MYEVILSNKIECPICFRSVHLLQDRSETNPKFFICHPCNFVSQIGVGSVTPLPDHRILHNVKLEVISPLSKEEVGRFDTLFNADSNMRMIDSYCEKCNKKGFRLAEGEFTNHYVNTRQTFDLYCKEQIDKGINIIHDIDGCSICNPDMKWPPGIIKRFILKIFGVA